MIGSIFTLSQSQLQQKTLSATSSISATGEEVEGRKLSSIALEAEDIAGGLSCKVCRLGVRTESSGFADVSEQREHFKSDWHRYNLHRFALQKPVIAKEQFEQLLENDDISSISGSESDPDEEMTSLERAVPDRTGMLSLTLEDGSSFRIWKCLVMSSIEEGSAADALSNALQRSGSLHKWAVILAKGGHFAATCFEKQESSDLRSKGASSVVGQHKTFHRYVTRAKSGGRQSTKDATGKHARSAGASLRRYNEAALNKDIANLLHGWKKELDACDLIFTSVSATDSGAVFCGGSPPLNANDSRIRRIPFPTRRPTFSESKRVSNLLTAMYKPTEPTNDTAPRLTQLDEILQVAGSEIPEQIEERLDVEESSRLPTDTTEVAIQQKSGRKKSRRKPKTKDQRRRAAVRSTTIEDSVEAEGQGDSGEDEVERAIAEVTQYLQRMDQSRRTTSQTSQRQANPRSPNDVEQRRELMRQAAERRMAALQATARNQQLW